MWNNLIRLTSWAALWAVLFWLSRANHPTGTLDFAATTVMILASVLAYTALKRMPKSTTIALKLFAWILCIGGAGLVSALAIKVVYDFAVGPDPRRFGLVPNIGMDTVVVLVAVTIMGTIDWRLGRLGLKKATN